MELIVPFKTPPQRLAILPATFNPPTCAHVALAEASLKVADAAMLVLPRVFPHKEYEGASLDDRTRMLRALAATRPAFAAAVSDGGLFIDIAREARQHYPEVELFVVCGRDAAERIVNWDYGEPGAINRMLEVFRLLVAPRYGHYQPPEHLRRAIQPLDISDYDDCSSTEVRERIRSAQPWKHLVPVELVEIVTEVYR